MLAMLVWINLACGPLRAPEQGTRRALVGPLDRAFGVPGWKDRDYLLHLPPGYDGAAPLPVVLAFHGGGGKKEGVNRSTCPSGDESSPDCLVAVADREGFAVVFPDGVDAPGLRGRSWNAGGGEEGWRCVGGEACATGSDDVAYVDALLDELRRAIRVDDARIYATGISNGAAMSHRLACERADVFAAIAPIAGASQVEAWPGCAPARAVPILHMHGTEDPCWGYDGVTTEPLCDAEGVFIDVERSIEAWRTHNGCTGAVERALEDRFDDGTTVTEVSGEGCDADTVLLRIEGGGHTWPGGWLYLSESRIGRVSQEIEGNAALWSFFGAHPMP